MNKLIKSMIRELHDLGRSESTIARDLECILGDLEALQARNVKLDNWMALLSANRQISLNSTNYKLIEEANDLNDKFLDEYDEQVTP